MQTILVIEDNDLLLKMYRKKFENMGYRVKTAMNGVDGLRMALEEKPDLILLDVKMPVKDGLTMLEELRQDSWGKSARVIISSVIDPDGQILNRVMSALPTYYLLKGENRPEKVLEKVQEILNS